MTTLYNLRGLPMTEAAWESRVLDYAKLRGWLCHHSRPAWTKNGFRTAIGGHGGFPDWVFARPGWPVYFIELKTERGRLRNGQEQWIDVLNACPGVIAEVWRPSDWNRIQGVLT